MSVIITAENIRCVENLFFDFLSRFKLGIITATEEEIKITPIKSAVVQEQLAILITLHLLLS
jgi:hypothetical protein